MKSVLPSSFHRVLPWTPTHKDLLLNGAVTTRFVPLFDFSAVLTARATEKERNKTKQLTSVQNV